ncbi:hypothetical protein O7632_08255 [Solwaraspora sp. WMMD406]|uniref:hypothetical protein n=1 Tax=Solwaraspora sp. WMMD406 TaxID=3016095 RepID=UPI0024179BCD|nr:hypothetical protein [Solwaraspora sp. WMMD406]MDG4764097.1 hypothetical protein [Solwaraspora sp. WMMD406]
MGTSSTSYRPAPDALLLTGTVAALLGFLLPWFKADEQRQWWYSGWSYLTVSSGAGWIWWVVAFLTVAILASLWARRSVELALLAAGATTAGLFLAAAVVAVTLGGLPERSNINWVGELPFGIGLPLMATGFGAAAAGALAATRR